MLDMLFWIFQKYSLSLGYDVNPSILERQGMENQAANRVSLFFVSESIRFISYFGFSAVC